MYVSAPTCFGYVSAVREQSRSRRARHTLQINLGLLALKNCINALHNNLAHTPYQDSKLTMLLQGPLPRLLDDRPITVFAILRDTLCACDCAIRRADLARKPLCSEQSDLPSSCVSSERRLGSGVASQVHWVATVRRSSW